MPAPTMPAPSNRVALVTGASSGIGRAAAEALLGAGWQVGLFARRRAPLEELAARHPGALVLQGDVTSEADVATGFAALVERFGRLDLLFNNAGIFPPAALIDEISLEDWRRAVDVNLTGMFLAARAAFAQMRRQEPQGGRILNNGSISAHAPRPGSMAYTSTKHAITGLTKTLALDGRPFNIAAGQIDIGNATTELASAIGQGVRQADGTIRAEPMIGLAEVAASVLHMASLPQGANIPFLTVMATNMPWLGRG